LLILYFDISQTRLGKDKNKLLASFKELERKDILRNQKVLDLVYLALFMTIIVVITQVPNLGFIPLGITTATIGHIPVIIAAIYFGKKLGVLTGTLFGVMSLVTAYVRPNNAFDLLFQNPIISVLPRAAFAFLTVVIYNALKVLKNERVRVLWSAFFGSLVHSVLVIGALFLVYYKQTTAILIGDTITPSAVKAGIVALLGSILAEAILSAIITLPVISALRISHKSS